MAAYQTGTATLLEREAVNVLYREVQLDLKGLTEGGTSNLPQPLQAAYWFVDGDYQSYETTNLQVEVVLSINRMFGRISMETLRGVPDGRFFGRIKQTIDTRMQQDASPILLSLANEATAQMEAGKELVRMKVNHNVPFYSGKLVTVPVAVGYYYEEPSDRQEFARIRRNAEEAIKAFETVLLLEPTNREAKMCLAMCFRHPTIARMEESRNLLRKMLEEPVRDEWTDAAEQELLASFSRWNPDEKSRWFAAAALQNTNSALNEFYQQNATNDVAMDISDEKAVAMAEGQQLLRIRSCKQYLDNGNTANSFSGFHNFTNYTPGFLYSRNFGLDQLLGQFPDEVSRERELARFLPEVESEFPELAPHVAAEALQYLWDTNSSVVAEFQKQLEWCVTHSNQVYHPENYWDLARNDALSWLFAHQQHALALETMEGYYAAVGPNIGDQDKVTLAFAFLEAENWRKALEIFDSLGKMPVTNLGSGPWGNGRPSVFPSEEADFCREKLGFPVVSDPREFQMGKALCYCSTFAFDGTGLWIVTGNQLSRLDMNLRVCLKKKTVVFSGA